MIKRYFKNQNKNYKIKYMYFKKNVHKLRNNQKKKILFKIK